MKSEAFTNQLDCVVRTANEEDGFATYLTGFALAIGLLALMLIFMPFMGLYGNRRVSQNGADAAAHAAAGFYADELSIRFPQLLPYRNPLLAYCTTIPSPTLDQVRDQTRREAIDLYRAYYQGYVRTASGVARGVAQQYASANKTNLAPGEFSTGVANGFTQFRYHHRDTGRTLRPLLVRLGTDRSYTSRTGQTSDVPASAAALAYIDKVRAPVDRPTPSLTIFEATTPPAPCTTWEVQYEFFWEITMVRYD